MYIDLHYSGDLSAHLTDAKDLPEPQFIYDDNDMKLLLKNIMHL